MPRTVEENQEQDTSDYTWLDSFPKLRWVSAHDVLEALELSVHDFPKRICVSYQNVGLDIPFEPDELGRLYGLFRSQFRDEVHALFCAMLHAAYELYKTQRQPNTRIEMSNAEQFIAWYQQKYVTFEH